MTSKRRTVQTVEPDVFIAIAHPVRRELLDILLDGANTVNHLAEPFDVSRSAISQHLGILIDAGLVQRERQGRQQVYQLRPDNLNEIYEWVKRYEHFWTTKLDTLGKILDDLAANQQEQGSDEA